MTPPDIVTWACKEAHASTVLAPTIDTIAAALDATSGDPVWTTERGTAATVQGPSDPVRHRHASGVIVETNRSAGDTHIQFNISSPAGERAPVSTVSIPFRRDAPTDPGIILPHALRLLRVIPTDRTDGSEDAAHWGRGVAAITSTESREVRHLKLPDVLRHETEEPFGGLILQAPDFSRVDHPLLGALSSVLPTMIAVRTSERLLRVERVHFSSHAGNADPIDALRAVRTLRLLMEDAS